MNIPTTKPYFPDKDIRQILKNTEKMLHSGRFFRGPFLEEFEKEFARIVGTKHAIAMNSATAALQAILEFYDCSDREVIVPTNTFIATPNAVLFAGGTPVLVDMHHETLCIDPVDLEKKITKKTKGIILVHLNGLITPHIEEIRALCKKSKLFLIEDASHAHGARRGKVFAGAWGDAAAFSFFATKVITSGGLGGMLMTNNEKLTYHARSVRFHGEDEKRGIQDRIGASWSLSELQAIVGLTQTKRLSEIVRKRMAIARAYDKAFNKILNVKTFLLPKKTIHSHYKYLLLLESPRKKKQVALELKKRGIATGSLYWPPCHLQPVYKKLFGYKKGDFPVAEDILSRTIALPMYTVMTREEITYVIKGVQKVCN